ncbi:hypothetical protein LINPERPRIM_LOCUS21955, partial [Linum perenne]
RSLPDYRKLSSFSPPLKRDGRSSEPPLISHLQDQRVRRSPRCRRRTEELRTTNSGRFPLSLQLRMNIHRLSSSSTSSHSNSG